MRHAEHPAARPNSLEPNVDYGCTLTPGSDGAVISSANAFTVFNSPDPAVQEAQQIMASTILDPEVQLEFSALVGSLPVRTDVNVDSLDACSQAGFGYRVAAEDAGTGLPAVSHMEGTTPAKSGVFLELAQTFFEDPNMTSEAAIEFLVRGLRDAS